MGSTESVWSVFKYAMVSYMGTESSVGYDIPLPMELQNLQSNFENPLNTQKHGELFHASWNLKLSQVLRILIMARFFIPHKNTFPTVLRAIKNDELKNNGNYKLQTMPEDNNKAYKR